jgi:hypothetical protein
MDIKPECLTGEHSYTVEDIVGTILQMGIKLNYIKRENLTTKGEMLLSGAEKHESDSD